MRLFNRKPKEPSPRKDYRTYTFGGVWGYHVEFWEPWDNTSIIQKVWGHWTPPPIDGDILKMTMGSGKTTVWIFQTVERKYDPPDMFFANIYGLGYEEDVNLPESTETNDYNRGPYIR